MFIQSVLFKTARGICEGVVRNVGLRLSGSLRSRGSRRAFISNSRIQRRWKKAVWTREAEAFVAFAVGVENPVSNAVSRTDTRSVFRAVAGRR